MGGDTVDIDGEDKGGDSAVEPELGAEEDKEMGEGEGEGKDAEKEEDEEEEEGIGEGGFIVGDGGAGESWENKRERGGEGEGEEVRGGEGTEENEGEGIWDSVLEPLSYDICKAIDISKKESINTFYC